jgi:hypothetical protein
MATARKLTLYPSAMTSAEWADIEPAVRNSAFFSATVEDERLLGGLQKMVEKGLAEGWTPAAFVDNALQTLDSISLDPNARSSDTFKDSFETLYDTNRLRLVFRSQNALADGYRNFQKDFSDIQMQLYPGWKFVRQPVAKESQKRPDHVKHEGAIRLKTDEDFWLARNAPEIGGFGNPYGPWGFNSWMRTKKVDRDTCIKLGLLKPDEKAKVPDAYKQQDISKAVQSMGKTGTADLTPKQRQNIVQRCKQENIKVTEQADALQVVPDKGNEKDALWQLQELVADAWLNDELKQLELMSTDELLKYLLNE